MLETQQIRRRKIQLQQQLLSLHHQIQMPDAVLVGGCIVLMEMIVGMQRQAGQGQQGQQGKTGQGKAWHPDTPWLTVKMLSYNKWSANQGRVLKSHAKVLERRDS